MVVVPHSRFSRISYTLFLGPVHRQPIFFSLHTPDFGLSSPLWITLCPQADFCGLHFSIFYSSVIHDTASPPPVASTTHHALCLPHCCAAVATGVATARRCRHCRCHCRHHPRRRRPCRRRRRLRSQCCHHFRCPCRCTRPPPRPPICRRRRHHHCHRHCQCHSRCRSPAVYSAVAFS